MYNYHFARYSTAIKIPVTDSHTEDAKDANSDSQASHAHQSECQTTVRQIYNEAQSNPLTEMKTKKSSSRITHNPLLTPTLQLKLHDQRM